MSQTIRGGRAIIDRLLAGLAALDELAAEASEHAVRNPLRAKDRADDIRDEVRQLLYLIRDELEPMLLRRDKAGSSQLDDILSRLAALETWRAEHAREQSRERPLLREVPRERG